MLGIDIGTTSVKGILICGQKEIVCEASAEHDLYAPHPGWAEERAEDWWSNTVRVIREILQKIPDAYSRIQAIGVSGMVPAIVLLDENGKALRPAIQQNDARAIREIAEVTQRFDQEELFRQTGGFTNQQHVLPRLLWVKRNEPEVWRQIRTVCGSYDTINRRLTGTRSIEMNWAVESGMFDIRKRQWLDDHLLAYGIDPDWLPPVRLSGEPVGTVSREAARITGLVEGIPVMAGSADHVASTLAAGITEAGDLLIKFGGAGDILYCQNELQPARDLFFDYHLVPDRYLLNGCMAASGSLVKWYARQFLQGASPELFQQLDREAAQVRPGSDGLVILPYFLGEKTPIFDPQARGVMVGLTLAHTRGHIFRAILESVIYGFRHHLDVLAGLGCHPKRIFATNGGAKSSFWCQIAADVLNREVRSFPSHPGSALGVAFMAGMSVGLYSDWREIGDFLHDFRQYSPQDEAVAIYEKTYRIYRELYPQLTACFQQISEIY